MREREPKTVVVHPGVYAPLLSTTLRFHLFHGRACAAAIVPLCLADPGSPGALQASAARARPKPTWRVLRACRA